MGQEPPPKKRKVTKCPLPSVHKQCYATDQIGNQRVSSPTSLSPELVSIIVKEAPETPLRALPSSKGKPTDGGEVFHPLHSTARSTQKERACTKTVSAGSSINIMDMRNVLISLLQETPKGMTLRALEKAVTEGLTVNPERKLIEKVIKSIATFHAPGKYILNPGVEKGTFVDAVIGSSGKSNETSCVETIEEKPITDSMVESIKSHDSPVNVNISPQPVYSHVTNEFVGKSPGNGAMDAKAIASRGSDSSSTNESESESGTGSMGSATSASESGTGSMGSATSASESSSGSESDVSTSSSDPSMDEDVDIMSDGEDEIRSDMNHQRLKGEDVKLQVKEASKLQDDFENTEGIDSETLEKCNANLEVRSKSPGEVWLPLEGTKVKEREWMAGSLHETECMADSLHETAFGPDKDDDVMLDSHVPLKDDDVMLDSHVPLKDDNLNSSLNSSTLRNEASLRVSPFSQRPLQTPNTTYQYSTQTPSNSQIEAEMLDKQTDTFPGMPESHQEHGCGNQEQRKRNGSYQSTSISHMEARAEKRAKQLDILVDKIYKDKDVVSDSSCCVNSGAHQTIYHRPSCEVRETVEKNEPDQHSPKQESRQSINKVNGNSNPNGSPSLEASTEIFVGSLLKAKDRLQKVGRPSREANSVDKLRSKQHSSVKLDKLMTTNQRKKHGKDADKHEATTARMSECNERVAPQIASTSMCMLTNSGETVPRRGTSLKAQQCPRKDAGAKKPTTGRINKDALKASTRNSLEWAERTSSVEEQVERPKKDAGLSKQASEYAREGGRKETGLKARPPNNGMLSSIASKEGRRMETGNIDSGHSLHSGHALSRSFIESKRCDSQDLELGEFREPLSENEVGESKSLASPRQPARDPPVPHVTGPRLSVKSERHCFEATSRATSSVSPDSKTWLPLSKSRLEASPAQGENNILQELHSQERRAQDARRVELYRPLKKNQGAGQSKQKQGADRVKQLQHGRLVSTNKDPGGSTRSGGLHIAGSRETTRKHSNKLLGNSNAAPFSQQKARNATLKVQEAHRADDSRTSQSLEVHGGNFFALYEKEKPELRGAIYSLDQFRDYYQEFNEKYPVYTQLNASLENDKENFEMFRKDIEAAKHRDDMAKLAIIYGIVRKEYFKRRKRSKRMRHTFKVLHEELQVIKQHCKDYAQKSRRRR